jgi:hypothetical protein
MLVVGLFIATAIFFFGAGFVCGTAWASLSHGDTRLARPLDEVPRTYDLDDPIQREAFERIWRRAESTEESVVVTLHPKGPVDLKRQRR